MNLTLRYMKMSDVPQVSMIDNASFDPPWPFDSYKFEINQSTVSHMLVLEEDTSDPNMPAGQEQLWGRISRWLTSDDPPPHRKIVGYGGLWKIAEEAHVSTIATHPDARGKGYGEILFAGMFGKSVYLDAEYIVLEVRASNHIAQQLYAKYGFVTHGVKKQYYRSNQEDGYDMRVIFDDDIIETYHSLYYDLQQKCPFIDNYSTAPHPRRGID